MVNKLEQYIKTRWRGGLLKAWKWQESDIDTLVNQGTIAIKKRVSLRPYVDDMCVHQISKTEAEDGGFVCDLCGEIISQADCELKNYLEVLNLNPQDVSCRICRHRDKCVLYKNISLLERSLDPNQSLTLDTTGLVVPTFKGKGEWQELYKTIATSACNTFTWKI